MNQNKDVLPFMGWDVFTLFTELIGGRHDKASAKPFI